MATAVLLLLCWLVHTGYNHPYFYPGCETMNCSRVLEMPRSFNTIQRSLDSVTRLGERVHNMSEQTREGVNFDDLRIHLLSVANTADDFKTENGIRREKFKNNSRLLNFEEFINGRRVTIFEIEKQVDDVTKFIENDVEQRIAELATLITRSKEKGEKLRRDLDRVRNHLHHMKGRNLNRIMEGHTNKMDKLAADAVKRTEYSKDTTKLLTAESDINSQLHMLLNRSGHFIFAPEILELLSIDDYVTRLSNLKKHETDLNDSLEIAQSQKLVLLNKIRELNRQITENGHLIDQLKNQVSGNTNISSG